MNKLYRSRSDQMIAGVCSGLGKYFGIDPSIVRLFFALLFFAGGGGLVIYIILAIIMPYEPEGYNVEYQAGPISENPKSALLVGTVLILIGAFFFVNNLDIGWLHWLNFKTLWPSLLILGGGVMLWQFFRQEA
jgi:phage shock protein C